MLLGRDSPDGAFLFLGPHNSDDGVEDKRRPSGPALTRFGTRTNLKMIGASSERRTHHVRPRRDNEHHK
jgi:hypothetical protein